MNLEFTSQMQTNYNLNPVIRYLRGEMLNKSNFQLNTIEDQSKP